MSVGRQSHLSVNLIGIIGYIKGKGRSSPIRATNRGSRQNGGSTQPVSCVQCQLNAVEMRIRCTVRPRMGIVGRFVRNGARNVGQKEENSGAEIVSNSRQFRARLRSIG